MIATNVVFFVILFSRRNVHCTVNRRIRYDETDRTFVPKTVTPYSQSSGAVSRCSISP